MRTVRVEAPPAPEGEAAPGTEVPSDAVVASSDALAAALSAAFAVEGAVVVVGDDKAAGEAAPAAAAPAPAAAAAVATTPAKKAWGAPAAGECESINTFGFGVPVWLSANLSAQGVVSVGVFIPSYA